MAYSNRLSAIGPGSTASSYMNSQCSAHGAANSRSPVLPRRFALSGSTARGALMKAGATLSTPLGRATRHLWKVPVPKGQQDMGLLRA